MAYGTPRRIKGSESGSTRKFAGSGLTVPLTFSTPNRKHPALKTDSQIGMFSCES